MSWQQTARVNDLLMRLNAACVGSCTCLTKSPDVGQHNATCHYRLFCEAADSLRTTQAEVERLRRIVPQERVIHGHDGRVLIATS